MARTVLRFGDSDEDLEHVEGEYDYHGLDTQPH
jgi:hypothetical protein